MDIVEALDEARRVRYELSLAIVSAPSDSPMRSHIAWHNFQQWFGSGDVYKFADEIEYVLIPKLLPDPTWTKVVPTLTAIPRYLRTLDSTFYVGCARCT